MDQSVERLGVPNPGAQRSLVATSLGEATYVAFLTGLIYLFAGAFQQGYQDQFGFTYISLGIEDVIDILRKFLVPLTIGTCGAVAAAFAFLLIKKTSRANRLSSVFINFLPISLSVLFLTMFSWSGHISEVDQLMFWLLPAFYLFEPSFWRFVFEKTKATEFAVPPDRFFRLVQLGIASLLLVITAYNVGTIYALTNGNQLLCPQDNGRQSILVGQSKDLLICAETDLATRKVYRSISYQRVPENGKSVVLKAFQLVPSEIIFDDRPQ